MDKMVATVSEKPELVSNVLFLEGITRAGKFLLANLLAAFDTVEPVQYKGIVEYIPYLLEAKLIEKKTAQQILRCEVDLDSYEMFIGRNFNLRREDKSSIYNHPSFKTYLERSEQVPREDLVKNALNKGIYSTFILHETMPNIKIILDTFKLGKVISIRRDPLDLAYSWYQRGFGKRWGNDPVLFQITFHSQYGPIPWFARSWAKKYYRLSEADKVAASIEYLWTRSEETYHELSSFQKKQILRVKYEDILVQPTQAVSSIAAFLDAEPSGRIRKIYKQEKLPNSTYGLELAKKEAQLQQMVDEKYFKALLSLREQYHQK